MFLLCFRGDYLNNVYHKKKKKSYFSDPEEANVYCETSSF